MKILDKSMVWARGVRSLLCLLLVIFAISCKQTNLSDEVISITVKGDSNCIINKLNIVKINVFIVVQTYIDILIYNRKLESN